MPQAQPTAKDAIKAVLQKWTEPDYPGDVVRILHFRHGEERGDIRVQEYADDKLLVASFLPGIFQMLPGDTPKTWPERSKMVRTPFEAEVALVELVKMAEIENWELIP